MNSHARSLDDIVESGVIEIAVYNDFPPYSFISEQGTETGLDVDIGRHIAQALNVEPKWLWFDADENLGDDLRNVIWKGRKIDRRTADLMMRVPYDSEFSHAIDGYGLPKNDLVVMFGPYHAEGWMIARDLKRTGTSRSLAIFRYEKIGVELDSLPDFFLSGIFGGSVRDNVLHYKNISSAVSGMALGEVSAVVGMQSQVQWSVGEKGLHYDLDSDGIEQIGKQKWDIGMAVRHDFRELAYTIEDIIDKMVNTGVVKRIFDKYNIQYLVPEYYTVLGS